MANSSARTCAMSSSICRRPHRSFIALSVTCHHNPPPQHGEPLTPSNVLRHLQAPSWVNHHLAPVHQPEQAATRDKLGHNCQLVGLHGKVVNTMPSEVQKALGNGPVLIWPLCSLNVHATLLLFIPGRCTGTEQAAIANMSGPTPSAMRCHQPHLHDCSHEEHNVGVTQACHDVNLILELLHGGGGCSSSNRPEPPNNSGLRNKSAVPSS